VRCAHDADQKRAHSARYRHTPSKGREFAIIGLKLVLLGPRRNDEI